MKPVLNLYLLGVVLTLLSIFVRLMESLEGLLESPLPGSSGPPEVNQPAQSPRACSRPSIQRGVISPLSTSCNLGTLA